MQKSFQIKQIEWNFTVKRVIEINAWKLNLNNKDILIIALYKPTIRYLVIKHTICSNFIIKLHLICGDSIVDLLKNSHEYNILVNLFKNLGYITLFRNQHGSLVLVLLC